MLDQKINLLKIIFGPKTYFDQKNFLIKNCFGPAFFFDKKFVSYPKFSYDIKSFSNSKFVSHLKFFWTQTFVQTQNELHLEGENRFFELEAFNTGKGKSFTLIGV